MCKECVQAIEKYFPDCPIESYGDFLISATAFPAGSTETVERQLKQAREVGCQTWQDAVAYASSEMLAQMSKEKSQSPRRKRMQEGSKGGTGTDKTKEEQRLSKNAKERERYRKKKLENK